MDSEKQTKELDPGNQANYKQFEEQKEAHISAENYSEDEFDQIDSRNSAKKI